MKQVTTSKPTIRTQENLINTEPHHVFEAFDRLVSTTRIGLAKLRGERELAMFSVVPYIAKLAKTQCRNIQHLEDYFQAGLVGAMKAYKRFRPEEGNLFVTFAHYSIVHAMNDLTRDLILVPMSHRDMERKCTLTRLAHRFWEIYHRMPQLDELTEMAHREGGKGVKGLTTEQVRRLIRYCSSPLYLDAPANGDDPSITLGDVLAYEYFGLSSAA